MRSDREQEAYAAGRLAGFEEGLAEGDALRAAVAVYLDAHNSGRSEPEQRKARTAMGFLLRSADLARDPEQADPLSAAELRVMAEWRPEPPR